MKGRPRSQQGGHQMAVIRQGPLRPEGRASQQRRGRRGPSLPRQLACGTEGAGTKWPSYAGATRRAWRATSWGRLYLRPRAGSMQNSGKSSTALKEVGARRGGSRCSPCSLKILFHRRDGGWKLDLRILADAEKRRELLWWYLCRVKYQRRKPLGGSGLRVKAAERR
jgi:hypothetical protein